MLQRYGAAGYLASFIPPPLHSFIMEPDYDEMAMEAHLFPWLDSDCMADDCQDEDYFEDEDDEN